MQPKDVIIASGNLATARRTILGVLAQCALLQVDDHDVLEIFTAAGLPERALQELEFPISLERELPILNALVRSFTSRSSPACMLFKSLDKLGIESLGVLGMAMRHANSAIQALQICLTYPQLTGGHSRLVVKRHAGEIQFLFTMERPAIHGSTADEIDNLVQYCLVLDLVSSMRNLEGIVGTTLAPLRITFAFAQPEDWDELQLALPCPVKFSGSETSLAYGAQLEQMPNPHANPLLYQSYVSIADGMSQMLAEDFSCKERATRWLWAYTPPPKRKEVAALLAMSERSLTRQLGKEGTSFSELLAQVQEERAKNFLRRHDVSIAKISDQLGYAEPAAFSRAFSQWTGMPPGRWRRKNYEHNIATA